MAFESSMDANACLAKDPGGRNDEQDRFYLQRNMQEDE